ncbi:MAG: LamG-like jellyroll fold domain-containing protein, partial [Sedimentisphaerales bacterium]|nr:LamG-like jellyroll fold domain-containing protein [Sedimentisphaerales bacterium]
GAVDADTSSLEWAAGPSAASYKVYLSTDAAIDESELVAESDLTIYLTVLDPGMTYYWRVDVVEADGTVREGDVWSFSTLPLEAHFPSPADGAEGVESGTTLSWTAGKGVIMHDVYFGTDEALVAAGDPSTFKGKVMVTSFDPGALELFQTYYWKVDEFSVTGTNAGPVWSFSAPGYIIIESAETTINYDNTADPFVSEIAWDTPADLRFGGVSDLTLKFQGGAASEGSASLDEATGTYSITGSGADIWGNADQFHYAYRELTGDAVMVARVADNGSGSNEWAKGGVMIRQSLDAGSAHSYMPITGGGGNGASFQGRPVADAASINADSGEVVAPPYWVKLERVGNDFTGSISPDGVTWTQLGGVNTVEMTDPVLIGLAVTSHASGEKRTMTFDNVSIEGDISADDDSTDIGIANNAPASIYVTLEDSTGAMATVTHGNPAATNIESWRDWTIPLDKFAGVDAASAAKLYVGVGDGTPGGTGSITVDDIFVVMPDMSAAIASWEAAAAAASPGFIATNVADSLVDIGQYGGEQTYEFIVRGNPDEQEASMALIGRRQFGDTEAGLKYEQWNNTGTYGATLFGVVDLDFGVANNPGADTHLVFVSSEAAGTTTLYVNGALAGSVDNAISLSGLVGIGYGAQGADGSEAFDNFDGDIFGVAIYDAALSDADIAVHAEAFFSPAADVTMPGDIVKGVPDDGDWPGGEYPALAIDDNTGTKFLHFKGPQGITGIQVTPLDGPSIVTGLTFTTANDAAERDPISFELSGSNDSIDGPYTLIASGDIVDFAQEAAWPRFTKNETAISFNNGKAYAHYQVIFPAVRDPGSANSMQIAEVELIGVPPADVTAAGDVVKGVPDEPRDGSVAGWPDAEYPGLAVDNDVSTKFLHFKGEVEPTGFVVEPASGASIVTALTFTTANDAPERDPISFELSGSNDSIDGPYTLIASGDIVDFAMEAAWPRFTKNATPISFDNDVAYKYYQVMFPTVRDPGSANSMQIAEVELIGAPGKLAAASLLSVVRSNGVSGDRDPVGPYDGSSAPLATEPGGLMDGNLVYSDRTYPWAGVPAEYVGSEYIRTYNSDKNGGTIDVTYEVTISRPATVWITVDDRIPAEWDAGGAITSPQDAADYVTAAFAAPGTFVDTGIDLFVHENDTTDRSMSVYAAELAAGTYVFGSMDSGKNFYSIGAVE